MEPWWSPRGTVPTHYWYLVDVLHVRDDSRFGVGRQSLGLEGPAHYEKIAVDRIRRYRLLSCGYFRARTIAGRPHGSSCIRLRFKDAAILELTESFEQLSRDRGLESLTRRRPNRGHRVWAVGKPRTYRYSSNRPAACPRHRGYCRP